jgi:hypothetical protein
MTAYFQNGANQMDARVTLESNNVSEALNNLLRRVDKLAPDFSKIVDRKSLETRASQFGEGKFNR